MKKLLLQAVIPALFSIAFIACKGKVSDADIKTAIENKKATMSEMAGINADVNDGVVTLTGTCKDDACKSLCESTVKAIPGVTSVINNASVAPPPAVAEPVVPPASDALSQAIADAVKDYPGVKTDLKDGVLTLTGEIKKSDLQKLMMSLSSLKSMGLAKIESSGLAKK